MRSFTLNLYDAEQTQQMTAVDTFIGEDASGYFGLQAGHARFMTTLVFGLARFRSAEIWHYLATPGGVLYFNANVLSISTRHFLLDTDMARIQTALQQQFAAEEQSLQATKASLKRMEHAMLQKLWQYTGKPRWLT